jgi:hypothetical protein
MTLAVDPVFSLLALAALALLFASAALAKLRDRERFAAIVDAYQVLPPGLARMTAVLLPFIELAAALGLFVTQVRPLGIAVCAGLLFIYASAIALNLARGRRDIDCGCEGFGRRRPIAGWMLVRNALLIAIAAVVVAPPAPRALQLTDVLTIMGGLAAFVLIYVAADELFAPRRLA